MLPSWVSSWCYQQIFRLDWKANTRYKHSSLFGLVISNEGKKFCKIGTWMMTAANTLTMTLSSGLCIPPRRVDTRLGVALDMLAAVTAFDPLDEARGLVVTYE